MPMTMGASPQAGLAMVGDPEVDCGFQGTDSGFPTSQSQERLFTAALRAGSHSDGVHENLPGSSYRQTIRSQET